MRCSCLICECKCHYIYGVIDILYIFLLFQSPYENFILHVKIRMKRLITTRWSAHTKLFVLWKPDFKEGFRHLIQKIFKREEIRNSFSFQLNTSPSYHLCFTQKNFCNEKSLRMPWSTCKWTGSMIHLFIFYLQTVFTGGSSQATLDDTEVEERNFKIPSREYGTDFGVSRLHLEVLWPRYV